MFQLCSLNDCRSRRRFAILTNLVIALFCFAQYATGADVVFPGAAWEAKKPQDLGLDDARLEAVAAALGSRGCAIKNGYVVKTWGAQDQKAIGFLRPSRCCRRC